jgi:hypothetical protein
MKVRIKKLFVEMDVKSNGIEFEVRKPDGTAQIGDFYLTMTGLIWCEGKKGRAKGISLSWSELMELLESKESKKAALKAVREPEDTES